MEQKITKKITENIQQLLAMAEHPNSNENEAAIALELAQKLLFRHNLTRADIINNDNGSPAGIGKLDHTETEGYAWKSRLVNVLAKANLCRVIGSSNKTWHIFGAYDNVKAVLEMYNWITLQLVWMANREYRAYKDDEGTERAQTWKAGFYQGAISTIRDRLDKPMATFAQGDGHALVVRTNAELDAAVHKVYPYLRRSSGSQARSYDGRSAGKQAAGNMTLASQRRLGGTPQLLAGH